MKTDYSRVSRDVKTEMLPLTIPIERGIPHLRRIQNEMKELAYLSQINLIDLQDKARAIIKRIPNYDEASQGYKIACHLVEEKVTRITV